MRQTVLQQLESSAEEPSLHGKAVADASPLEHGGKQRIPASLTRSAAKDAAAPASDHGLSRLGNRGRCIYLMLGG
jgi:hypothetical protein